MASKLGTLIKEGRAAKGWTQAQLAAKIKGLSASDIGRIERGEKTPETEQIRQIAKALGVTQTSLLNAAKGKTGSSKTSSAKTGAKESSSKAGGKTSSSKTGSGKTAASSKTGSGKTTAASKTSVTVTSAEKKLLQQYRKADDMTKKAVDNILAAAVPASGKNDGAGDLLNSLLGNVLEQVLGKK